MVASIKRWLRRFVSPVLSLTLLCSCQRRPLLVETEYINERSLASYWVGTPDPSRDCPSTGQRLYVSWRLPLCTLKIPDLHVELTVRFGDNTQDFRSIPVHSFLGTFTYSALDADYWNHCGIRTYQAQLIGDGRVLEQWRHQLWVELIELDAADDQQLPLKNIREPRNGAAEG